MYGDFTKDKKEKSQYHDTIHCEAEEGHHDRPCMCSWNDQYHHRGFVYMAFGSTCQWI